jgi:hypothetical protein
MRRRHLLIAAEAAGIAVLDYDEGCDRIAAITGQPTCSPGRKGNLR